MLDIDEIRGELNSHLGWTEAEKKDEKSGKEDEKSEDG